MYHHDLLRQIISLSSELERPNPPYSIVFVERADLSLGQGKAPSQAASIVVCLFIVFHD
jgi:hypothetical protein